MSIFWRSLLILVSALFIAALAHAQDSTKIATRSIGLGTGYAYSALKSERYSPMTHTGTGLPIQAYFRSWNPKRQWHVQLFYSSFSLSSEVNVLTTHEQIALFQYASHYRLGNKKKKITTWAGFVVDGQSMLRDFSSNLGYGTAVNNSSDEAFITINPSVLFEHALEKDKLSLQVWTTLVAYTVLPKDGGGIEGKLVSFGSFTKTEARLSYSKYFSRRFEGRIDGQFQVYALSVAQHVYKINTQAIASIAYKL